MHSSRLSLVTALLVASPLLICARPVVGQAVLQPGQAAAAPAQAAAATAPSAEEKPIRDAVDAFAKAYNTPDIQALGALFTDDANVVDSAG